MFAEKRVAIKTETFVDAKERLGAATRVIAVSVSFRTGSKAAEISPISIGSFLDDENVHLMVGNPGPAFRDGFELV